MPWTVLPQVDSARKHTHDTSDRIQGSCRDVVDAVVGWRFVRHDSWLKRLSSRIANGIRDNVEFPRTAMTTALP